VTVCRKVEAVPGPQRPLEKKKKKSRETFLRGERGNPRVPHGDPSHRQFQKGGKTKERNQGGKKYVTHEKTRKEKKDNSFSGGSKFNTLKKDLVAAQGPKKGKRGGVFPPLTWKGGSKQEKDQRQI